MVDTCHSLNAFQSSIGDREDKKLIGDWNGQNRDILDQSKKYSLLLNSTVVPPQRSK